MKLKCGDNASLYQDVHGNYIPIVLPERTSFWTIIPAKIWCNQHGWQEEAK